MQLTDHFDVLLNDTVNLSRFKLDLLGDRVDRIFAALKDDAEIGSLVRKKIPQGSWAHRTIINPVGDKEFDADFLLVMDENPDWADSPKQYIEQVYVALGRNSSYKDMPRQRKCRCVTLTYADLFHVDIVPYIEDRRVIVNRDEDEWEPTDPAGFTAWMKEKDSITGGNLRKIIRLMKYLRDHRNSFTGTRSIILTTVLGERVDRWRKIIDPGYYSNMATTLLHVVKDLDDWLQDNPTKPSIPDPSGSGVTFDHRWDQSTYSYFRDRIHTHAGQIDDAYHEADKETSVKLWQDLFGAGFKAPKPRENSGRFGSVAAVAATTAGRSGRAG